MESSNHHQPSSYLKARRINYKPVTTTRTTTKASMITHKIKFDDLVKLLVKVLNTQKPQPIISYQPVSHQPQPQPFNSYQPVPHQPQQIDSYQPVTQKPQPIISYQTVSHEPQPINSYQPVTQKPQPIISYQPVSHEPQPIISYQPVTQKPVSY